jgi:ribosomal protein L30/L7E
MGCYNSCGDEAKKLRSQIGRICGRIANAAQKLGLNRRGEACFPECRRSGRCEALSQFLQNTVSLRNTLLPELYFIPMFTITQIQVGSTRTVQALGLVQGHHGVDITALPVATLKGRPDAVGITGQEVWRLDA